MSFWPVYISYNIKEILPGEAYMLEVAKLFNSLLSALLLCHKKKKKKKAGSTVEQQNIKLLSKTYE